MGVVLIIVVVAAIEYSLSGSRQKFQVSDLQVRNATSYDSSFRPLQVVSFTLSNQNSVPISSVSVVVNVAVTYPFEGSSPVSSGNPISQGQSRVLELMANQDETPGASYYSSIVVYFGDGSAASYSATVKGA